MGTKVKPGKYDCYAAAQDDEPIFVLRAKDPRAPNLVRNWSDHYLIQKQIGNSVGNGPEPLTESQREKYLAALACAAAMEAWRNANAKDDS